MESNVLSSVASSSRAKKSALVAGFVDSFDELRYLIMRTARLVFSIVFEILTLASAIVAGLSGLVSIFYILTLGWLPVGAKDWAVDPLKPNMLMDHPLALAVVSIPLTVFLLTQWLAVTMPYHYDTTPPGLRLKECYRCAAEVPDRLFCSSCKAFRLGRVFTAVLWVAGSVITVFYAVHDAIGIALGFVGRGKGMGA